MRFTEFMAIREELPRFILNSEGTVQALRPTIMSKFKVEYVDVKFRGTQMVLMVKRERCLFVFELRRRIFKFVELRKC